MIRLISAALILACVIAAVIIVIVKIVPHGGSSSGESESQSEQEGTLSGPPQPAVESSASIGATGDILLHNSVLNGAYQSDGTYDFTASFAEVAPYWSALDYMIVNLEVPMGGYGEPTGYPAFNAPDSIAAGLKNAGVDMCLTATNHSYDTGFDGLIHTQKVLNEVGLDYVGTRLEESADYVLTKDINGIRFGFACYTYDTRTYASDSKSLNGIPLASEAENLVNSFCYSDLDTLYASVQSDLENMEEQGCDVTVFFMHWGNEYTDYPNDYETQIAAKLCDLGVDVIIGGHPHVIQQFDVLTGESGNTTYCLYSTGNAISSQRKEIMTEDGCRGYTEDGIVMSFTYEKLNNGKVRLTDVNVLPTWVEIQGSTYTIVPLDGTTDTSNWQTYSLSEAIASYNRTQGRVGEAYPILKSSLGGGDVLSYIE